MEVMIAWEVLETKSAQLVQMAKLAQEMIINNVILHVVIPLVRPSWLTDNLVTNPAIALIPIAMEELVVEQSTAITITIANQERPLQVVLMIVKTVEAHVLLTNNVMMSIIASIINAEIQTHIVVICIVILVKHVQCVLEIVGGVAELK